jgi:hypothetical protein
MSFVSNAVRDLLLIFDNFYSPKTTIGRAGGGGPLNTHFIRFLHIYFGRGNKFNYLSATVYTFLSVVILHQPTEKSLSQIQ